MILRIYEPAFPLSTFVKSIIYYKGYSGHTAYEKLLPDGNSQLIIELDGNQRVLKKPNDQPDLAFKNAWITGIQTKPCIYESEQNATTVCIQFKSGGLSAFLGIPGSEFVDTMVDAVDILGSEIIQFRERLADQFNAEEIFTLANQFLANKILQHNTPDRLFSFLTKKLCHENVGPAHLSRQVGYSQKQLIQIFKNRIGISPKKYQRIYRFNKALSLLTNREIPNYSDISFRCHFYDQSHFIHEFRNFSGYSPTQYLKCERDYPHVVTLNKYW